MPEKSQRSHADSMSWIRCKRRAQLKLKFTPAKKVVLFSWLLVNADPLGNRIG
jgi:hypothetical protein